LVELTPEEWEWIKKERKRTMQEMIVNKRWIDQLLFSDEEDEGCDIYFLG
jgi:hypothetical protein